MNKTTQPQGSKSVCDKAVHEWPAVQISGNSDSRLLQYEYDYRGKIPMMFNNFLISFVTLKPLVNEGHLTFSSIPRNVWKLGISKMSQSRFAVHFLSENSPINTDKQKASTVLPILVFLFPGHYHENKLPPCLTLAGLQLIIFIVFHTIDTVLQAPMFAATEFTDLFYRQTLLNHTHTRMSGYSLSTYPQALLRGMV